jgi:putative DNA methylase
VIPKECKRLAEVDFPIAVVSKHAAREKSIRHGHPSTLHLWWARRPLAACRAMLLALLLPDPCDDDCPNQFKENARALLAVIPGETKKLATSKSDLDLRKALLKFIGDFANWDLSSNRDYLAVSRGLVKAAHGEEPPLVVDPFSGGGSIPVEALRMGCDAFASDLNPVACLILKTMLEDIPRQGPQLSEDLRRVGEQIKQLAEEELDRFYPADPDGAQPIAYLWARTLRCEAPSCGAEIPLMRSFWLCRKANRKLALRAKIIRSTGDVPRVEFEIFEPTTEGEISKGTINRAKAICLCCHIVLSPERVRSQLVAQRGGADPIYDEHGHRIGGASLIAVVLAYPGQQGRKYRPATQGDYDSAYKAWTALEGVSSAKLPSGLDQVPTELVIQSKVAKNSPFRFHLYGIARFGDVSSSRQKLFLSTVARLVRERGTEKAPVRACLSILVNRLANASTSLSRWNNIGEKIEGMFTRQAISMVWDFAEVSPFAKASGGFDGALDWIILVIDRLSTASPQIGQVQQADAAESSLIDGNCAVWFTDPPYYDAVSYADLSDFFFAWLKRTSQEYERLQDPYDSSNPLTPKIREAIQDDAKQVNGRPKDRAFFEATMAKSFSEGRRALRDDGVGCVVFAHKTTEGWEALLSGMIHGGWVITGSWPIATEMGSRLRAQESAALATSVHLVCRPRTEATVGDWGEVFRELPKRVGDWMDRLESEGVRGADLVFACIGPALEIYSRYVKVVDAEEREIPLGGNPEATEPHLRGYLSYVWEVVGRTALEQVLGTAEARARNGAAGALEEDARLTALFLWTMQSTNGSEQKADAESETPEDDDEDDAASIRASKKGFSLLFDVVRRFAQPLGIRLPEWEGRIIETKKGVVRMLSVSERALQLFGEEGAEVVADRLETDSRLPLTGWLPGLEPKPTAPSIKGRGRKSATGGRTNDESLRTHREATTLDRVHAAMILQSSGRANALRALLKGEQERGADFVRLANALSALYPKDSEEKRLLDAMLLAVPR